MNPGTAIITGAAGGIGRAIARKLAVEGCRLTLVDMQEAALQAMSDELKGAYGTECLSMAGDLAVEDFLLQIAEETDSRFGRIDILVNNAAWRTLDSLRHIGRDSWQRTLDVCLTAPAFLGRHVAAVMERRATGGVIVNISSMMSDRPAGNSPAYIAAKAGLEGLTREMAVTYGRSGIRAVCIRPGFIDTGLSHDYETDASARGLAVRLEGYLTDATPLTGPGRPDEVAEAVAWLASPAASFITGTCLTIDGGFSHNLNSYPLKHVQFPDEY
jgi:NAD(P)-dependent dehydrogenase (short-subunit alcohol dehydrogenase family)